MSLLMGVPLSDIEALANDKNLARLLKVECDVTTEKLIPHWAAILSVVLVHFLVLVAMAAVLIRSYFRIKAINTSSPAFPSPSQASVSQKAPKNVPVPVGPKKDIPFEFTPAGSELAVSMNTKKEKEPKEPIKTNMTNSTPTTSIAIPSIDKQKTIQTNKETQLNPPPSPLPLPSK